MLELTDPDPVSIMGIGIRITGKVVHVMDLPVTENIDLDEFRTTNGIETVHDAGVTNGYELARGAIENALIDAKITAEDVDVLAHVRSRVPDTFISSECARLQHALGMKRAVGFGLSELGCADTSMALQLAFDRLTANPDLRFGVVSYGHCQYTQTRVRPQVTVHGDGGAAAVLGRGAGLRIIAMEHTQNGRYWDLFKVPFRDRKPHEYTEICRDQKIYSFELAIESQQCFKQLNDRMMRKTGFGFENVEHIILQNISARAFQFYEEAFDISIMPVCRHNLSRYGHLGGADILVNLGVALENRQISPGERVLVMNNSPTAAWSLILLEMSADPSEIEQ